MTFWPAKHFREAICSFLLSEGCFFYGAECLLFQRHRPIPAHVNGRLSNCANPHQRPRTMDQLLFRIAGEGKWPAKIYANPHSGRLLGRIRSTFSSDVAWCDVAVEFERVIHVHQKESSQVLGVFDPTKRSFIPVYTQPCATYICIYSPNPRTTTGTNTAPSSTPGGHGIHWTRLAAWTFYFCQDSCFRPSSWSAVSGSIRHILSDSKTNTCRNMACSISLCMFIIPAQ